MSEQKTEQPLNEIKTQESQLRSKYGNIEKRSGKHLLMKQLAGKKQYFDSGDYNMQQTKTKTSKSINPLAKPVGSRGKLGSRGFIDKKVTIIFSSDSKRSTTHSRPVERQNIPQSETSHQTPVVDGEANQSVKTVLCRLVTKHNKLVHRIITGV